MKKEREVKKIRRKKQCEKGKGKGVGIREEEI